jgi:hypothetical protein
LTDTIFEGNGSGRRIGSARRSGARASQSMSPWAPSGKERSQSIPGLRDRVGRRDAHAVEPVAAGELAQSGLQKSRSA